MKEIKHAHSRSKGEAVVKRVIVWMERVTSTQE